MNYEFIENAMKARQYRIAAIKALVPEELKKHVDVIENELMEMAIEFLQQRKNKFQEEYEEENADECVDEDGNAQECETQKCSEEDCDDSESKIKGKSLECTVKVSKTVPKKQKSSIRKITIE